MFKSYFIQNGKDIIFPLERCYPEFCWKKDFLTILALQFCAFPLHHLCNVDLKCPSHPESLQTLSTLFGGGGGRVVTKTGSVMFLLAVPSTFGQDCRLISQHQDNTAGEFGAKQTLLITSVRKN